MRFFYQLIGLFGAASLSSACHYETFDYLPCGDGGAGAETSGGAPQGGGG